MKRITLSTLLIASLVTSAGAIANTPTTTISPNVKISGTIPTDVVIHPKQDQHHLLKSSGAPRVKQVLLQHLILSDKAASYLAAEAKKLNSPLLLSSSADGLPATASLEMKHMPVLDQGSHGSCVTFADTGAINFILGKGDYVSQLCSLELGSTLENQGELQYSGWDGSFSILVLNQITKYGIVNIKTQRSLGCAGVKEYPLMDGNDRGMPMSKKEFASKHEVVLKDNWKVLLHPNNALSKNAHTDLVLKNVKKALLNGHPVVFGIGLDITTNALLRVNGAVGTYKIRNDSWVVSEEIARHAEIKYKIDAGHEMMVTGYDDNAVIIDQDGKRHTGVLTLRNSWSAEAGNQGDYYMSYGYFKLLVTEAAEISPLA
jgi:hypothetical protein